jgi:hypothetical protein
MSLRMRSVRQRLRAGKDLHAIVHENEAGFTSRTKLARRFFRTLLSQINGRHFLRKHYSLVQLQAIRRLNTQKEAAQEFLRSNIT